MFRIDPKRVYLQIAPDSISALYRSTNNASVLLPGQSQLISVPFAVGEGQQVLRIRRLSDQIEIEHVPGA